MTPTERHQWLIKNAPAALSAHAPNGVFLFASPHFRALLGRAPEDLIGRALHELTHPDDSEAVRDGFAEAATSQRAVITTYRTTSQDGELRWIETEVRPAHAGGDDTELACISRDVTRRRAAELETSARLEGARQVAEKLNAIITRVPGVVWEGWGQPDPTGYRANFVSDFVETITGYTPQEWLSRPDFWLHIMHPDDHDRVVQENNAIIGAGSGTLQYRWITKDGRTIWTETRQSVIRDEAGAIIGLRGVTMDITSRKDSEAEQVRLRNEILRAQEARLAELSTPLIPINDDIMVMPLIGMLDPARAESILYALLQGLSANRAKIAIVDITGVTGVDMQAAEALIRAAKAARLLGAEVVLTGIRPEAAQTLVNLGADLGRIVTRGSLQSGIAYAMTRR